MPMWWVDAETKTSGLFYSVAADSEKEALFKATEILRMLRPPQPIEQHSIKLTLRERP